MEEETNTARGVLARAWMRWRGRKQELQPDENELPLRSELLSADQMEERGKILAEMHCLRPGRSRERLLGRLAANERLLLNVHALLTEDIRAEQRISPAGEWLLDNFYVIEEQIRTASRHLPKGYSRELPYLATGPSAGLPRVYDMALETISHGDGRVDPEIIHRFVTAYQTVTPLKLGELWAIPIMLRLALIENLRRVAARIAMHRAERAHADHWADLLTRTAAREPRSLILTIADMARSAPPMTGSFVAELTRRLQGQGHALALPLTWIEQQLSESGLTIEQLVRYENQQQAADQVTMSNSIGSLRTLGAQNWREFIEAMSIVERILGEDPAGVYDSMDFATRDRYRHVVEKAARRSRLSEGEVARKAVELAGEAAARNGRDDRAAHVGFHLIDAGTARLKRAVGMRLSPAVLLRRAGRRVPLLAYAGGTVVMTAFFAVCLVGRAHTEGLDGWGLGLFAVLAVLCASHLAVALANWLATLLATPRPLPRMDFSKGIPSNARTLVVVPTMLTSADGIDALAKALEVRFLANNHAHLHFALLTDVRDAAEETTPEDEPLVMLARQHIEALNARYPGADGDVFFLFHRPRRWNPRDGIWMGHERKRGKLADLNAFLRKGDRSGFALVVGEASPLSGVQYVITLDTDTQLPRDAAWRFIGAMAHPLNRPRYDAHRQRVTAGYGILQPRVTASLSGANRSRYGRMCASEIGIDPYTRAVSDVYQDLFGEGSFIGKGIYDVDAFEQALGGRFPDNRILSHDLLEGCYARAGLMSDVQVYEDYPSRYGADVNRRHRWIRGDWQIARWLFPGIPGPDARMRRNPLSALSRWKILDNLRRSLMAAALTLLLVSGWTMLPSAWLWTLAATGIILLPSLLSLVANAVRKPDDVTSRQHLAAVVRSVPRYFSQALFTLACLPYEAFFSLDAVLRTQWRMLVSRRQLLQWNPSGESEQDCRTGLVGSYRTMWFAPAATAAVSATLMVAGPAGFQRLAVAAPVLCLWLAAPAIVWWLDRPLARLQERLTAAQTIFLRKIGRKTWAFFETFVGPADNWLPPDNYQEHPVEAVAHRTSPTNMGLALLANLAAHDFGMISGGRFVQRTADTLHAMNRLERHHGHFFNWYDTQTLNPLPPRYISSVDSGNLAGHLLTLRAGLLGLADQRILDARVLDGLADAMGIALELATGVAPNAAAAAAPKGAVPVLLAQLRRDMEAAVRARPTTLAALRRSLDRLASSAMAVDVDMEPAAGGAENPLAWWIRAFHGQCRDALDELALLAPWAELVPSLYAFGDFSCFDEVPTLRELAGLEVALQPLFTRHSDLEQGAGIDELQRLVATASGHARARIAAIDELAAECGVMARMEYGLLYDESLHLLAIGYNVDERRRDTSCYDLLASEARLASFVAIAQGQLPQENWFALGRLLTLAGGEPILLSWSGSMFEYLMPMLVMPSYANTLLDQTCAAAVARQVEYGRMRAVPWGISECGYNAIDVHRNYQYRAFGVPGLGLKRGLAEDLVIAPYATALALMVAPGDACRNLERLSAEGFEARYGFYEAIDYTPSRLPRGQTHSVVRSFMAHHQGMSFLALSHVLLDRPMQKRFESDSIFQATLLLLQERIPAATASYAHTTELSELHTASGIQEMQLRVFSSPDTPQPEVQLLSNGRYHVMVTNAGGGYSRWNDLAVTRWREDGTRDNRGTFCYLRDVASGEFWSAAHQPTLRRAERYEAVFSEGRAEFHRSDLGYDIHTEIAVSPEDDIELRRVRITNRSRVRRKLEVTSYAEVVLAPPAADALHPAFSNLFVQTEILRRQQGILCTRRPRAEGEHVPWLLHVMAVRGVDAEALSYETDRMRFIGRGNTLAAPQAVSGKDAPGVLSDSEGSVLDPVVAIRCRITLEPGQAATVDMVTGIGETRDAAMVLVDKYHDRHLADRVFDLTWTHGQVLLRQLGASEADAQLYGRLAGSILHANPALRADEDILARNSRGQSGLWGYAISGDLPIVLLKIEDPANIELVRQMVQAHAYWRLKGLAVDLVIWNEDHAGYRQALNDQIMGLIAAGIEPGVTDRPGGIFVRSADRIAEEDRILIQSVARVIISDGMGTLEEQMDGRDGVAMTVPALVVTRTHRPEQAAEAPLPRDDLIFYNGLGGFTPDGREYVITTAPGQLTPTPWVNVLANPNFGTVISESGLACTWSENAHEFRLTPWGNDPVSDSRGEAFYLRDEERGHFWSPTPLPRRGATPYVTRHGFGYSVFEHVERGIRTEMWVYVAMDAAVRFTVLKVRNMSGRTRRLSATGYAEWVLGDLPPKAAMHVATEIAPESGALFARNPYNTEFADRTAFFDVDEASRTVTGDRVEFLGRNGTHEAPAAMLRKRLSGRVGVGLDPCAAMQVGFELAAGQEREIVFRLGVGRTLDEARQLVARFRGPSAARAALDTVWEYWARTLGAIHVETPDQSLNVLANGWLLYQTLACRVWARAATYQSGGAFGFRDQLQDVMALVHAQPQLVRDHLLLCAAHQFVEGDVQHWWHPPMDRGVRTHCSDDYLWLPLATCRYVQATGDTGVLDESVHFLQGRPVKPDEDSYYDLPRYSDEAASLYEHCVRAILHGLAFGERGLPLMGSGDWNDGMDRVGQQGKGESVWLGFFLHEVLTRFAEVAAARGDVSFAGRCLNEADTLRANIERHGWDGAWYRRAYFDDGTPLGSAGNAEGRIDSIAQSWAVLSGAAGKERARMAMDAVDEHLVRRTQGLVQLLDPPFDTSAQNPGYIKGYAPGVRENGGQYTHAAIWAAMAFARMGNGRRAWELFTIINPVNHALSGDAAAVYKVEPYVVAADVYAAPPHVGRGGWTWYTGSAAWMYRLVVESLLGISLENGRLRVSPCLPEGWAGFTLHYRYHGAVYHLEVLRSSDEGSGVHLRVDGADQEGNSILLVDDGAEHRVEVRVSAGHV